MYAGERWELLNRVNSGLPSDTVRALTLDGKGNLWVGTANGVAEYREGGTVRQRDTLIRENCHIRGAGGGHSPWTKDGGKSTREQY